MNLKFNLKNHFYLLVVFVFLFSYLAFAQEAQEDCRDMILNDTVWVGQEGAENEYVKFKLFGDSILSYWNASGDESLSGTWSVDGTDIILSINNGYTTYTGSIKDLGPVSCGALSGDAENSHGEDWHWSVLQQP